MKVKVFIFFIMFTFIISAAHARKIKAKARQGVKFKHSMHEDGSSPKKKHWKGRFEFFHKHAKTNTALTKAAEKAKSALTIEKAVNRACNEVGNKGYIKLQKVYGYAQIAKFDKFNKTIKFKLSRNAKKWKSCGNSGKSKKIRKCDQKYLNKLESKLKANHKSLISALHKKQYKTINEKTAAIQALSASAAAHIKACK